MATAVASTLCLLAACAAVPAGDLPHDLPDAAPGLRVLVKLAAPTTDGGAVAAEAARWADVPVRYAAAISPQWHAVNLRCRDDTSCAAAFEKLRRAGGTYLAVERDDRKRAPKP